MAGAVLLYVYYVYYTDTNVYNNKKPVWQAQYAKQAELRMAEDDVTYMYIGA